MGRRTIRFNKELSSDELKKHRRRLLEFVDREKESKKEEAWRKYSQKDVQRLPSDQIATNLISLGRENNPDYGTQFSYRYTGSDEGDKDITNDFNIYPRSVVILDSEENTDNLPLEALVYYVGGDKISLVFPGLPVDNDVSLGSELRRLGSYTIYRILNETPYKRRKKAVKEAWRDKKTRDLISGRKDLIEESTSIDCVQRLNQNQEDSLKRAIGSLDVFCIHGPPGTGKSRTLRYIIRESVERGERVLACAHSNQAIDNLVVGGSTIDRTDKSSLHQMAINDELDIARVGRNPRSELVKQEYRRSTDSSLDSFDVVASTMSAASELNSDFDLLVVDEATQAAQPSTLIPINKADRIVLAGDHKQLPPYCSDETAKQEEMHLSLFEHLLNIYGNEIAITLDRQYRMNEEIAKFPNEAFYGSKLETDDSVAKRTVGNMKPLVGFQVDGEEKTTNEGKSKYNPMESEIASDQVARLQMEGLSCDEIGVITPYTAQVRKISRSLEENDRVEDSHKIKVDTIDSFQGSEKESIVISFVRSNRQNASGFLTFPDEGKRRLNVAITRAKSRCVLIADWTTLANVAEHKDESESCAGIYRKLQRSLEDRNLMGKA